MPFGQSGAFLSAGGGVNGGRDFLSELLGAAGGFLSTQFGPTAGVPVPQIPGIPGLQGGAPFVGGGNCPPLFRGGVSARMSPVPWFPVQAPSGKWFFFGHLGRPTFSKLKSPRRHHHHRAKR